MRWLLGSAADRIAPIVALSKPFVDGIENLPADGRFLLVGNHTHFGVTESVLIPYIVRRAIGTRVRPLADRNLGRLRGPLADLMAAYGGVVGSPEAAAKLMAHNETILVFPGGAREIAKFRDEEYTLRWHNRSGFARIAVEHQYPIVPVGHVGGDHLYQSLTTRESLWGRVSQKLSDGPGGRPDMAMPLFRGVGPTLIPRPQRMYLRFGSPIDTTAPTGTPDDDWIDAVRDRTKTDLEAILGDLQNLRDGDPFRTLNPMAWNSAVTPARPG